MANRLTPGRDAGTATWSSTTEWGGRRVAWRADMQWHALTLDGLMWDPLAETILSFRTGNMALGVTVDRLHRRLTEVLGSARGRWPIGLKAAIVAQLNLSAWDSWTSYREVERLTGQPFPTMTPSGIAALCSGKLLPKPTPGVDGDGFLLS